MEQNKFDLALGAALIPLLGTCLVLVNQLGRFMYYGIPAEMLELDAYKILISGISMFVVGGALIYTAATFHELGGSRWWHRLAFNIMLAALLTASFWMKDLHWGQPISWAIVMFVTFAGCVFYGIERWLRARKPSSLREQIAGWTLVVLFGSSLLLVATLTFGIVSEDRRTQFSFVDGTHDAVVAKSGDLLIIKTYDPEKRDFDRTRTKLLSVSSELTLETRTILRR